MKTLVRDIFLVIFIGSVLLLVALMGFKFELVTKATREKEKTAKYKIIVEGHSLYYINHYTYTNETLSFTDVFGENLIIVKKPFTVRENRP